MVQRRSSKDEPLSGQITLFSAETPDAFRKAVEVVHSTPQAPVTLLQRKLANQWIKHALQSAPDAEGWFTIPLSAMRDGVGYGSNNRDHLINSAREMMKIAYEWDVIAPANKRALWKGSVLFPEVELEPDAIRYQISKEVRDKVLKPEIYALIDMNVIRRLRKGASVALYENCVRYVRIKQTGEVPWTTLRDMLLGKAGKTTAYPEYKHFKGKVLKPAIAEINAESDITIDLRENRSGRYVTTVYFRIKEKAGAERVEHDGEQLELLSELSRLSVPTSEANKLLKKYRGDLGKLRAAIDYTRKRLADKKREKIDNPAAYFRHALERGWGDRQDVVGSPARQASDDMELEELFAQDQAKQAQGYFHELDHPDQAALIDRYNAQQEVPQFKLTARRTKAATVEFYAWLAIDTWGQATDADLLAFAKARLKKRA